MEAFRQLSPDNKPISSINQRAPRDAPRISHGAYYKAMAINVPRYLLYLQEGARSRGVEIVKARLPTDAGLAAALREAQRLLESRSGASSSKAKPACFVNATGLAAGKLCGDAAVFPIRGQTVLVKGEARATLTRVGDGYRAYCIPRPGSGTTILGGTREEEVWDEEPDAEVTARILERNAWQVPELLTGSEGGFEILSVQCGLRPGRRGGVRLEGERVGGFGVVHAYGHAGAGYQNSVGSARAVVELVGESLGRKGGFARL